MEILPAPFLRCSTLNRILLSLIIIWMFLSICLVFSSYAQVRHFLAPRLEAHCILAANTRDTIPAPLLDRMEVLEVRVYVSEEKSVIADKYLVPQSKEASGLQNADV